MGLDSAPRTVTAERLVEWYVPNGLARSPSDSWVAALDERAREIAACGAHCGDGPATFLEAVYGEAMATAVRTSDRPAGNRTDAWLDDLDRRLRRIGSDGPHDRSAVSFVANAYGRALATVLVTLPSDDVDGIRIDPRLDELAGRMRRALVDDSGGESTSSVLEYVYSLVLTALADALDDGPTTDEAVQRRFETVHTMILRVAAGEDTERQPAVFVLTTYTLAAVRRASGTFPGIDDGWHAAFVDRAIDTVDPSTFYREYVDSIVAMDGVSLAWLRWTVEDAIDRSAGADDRKPWVDTVATVIADVVAACIHLAGDDGDERADDVITSTTEVVAALDTDDPAFFEAVRTAVDAKLVHDHGDEPAYWQWRTRLERSVRERRDQDGMPDDRSTASDDHPSSSDDRSTAPDD